MSNMNMREEKFQSSLNWRKMVENISINLTEFENSSKILNFASEASYIYFLKTFGESHLPLGNIFRFFQILVIYSVK